MKKIFFLLAFAFIGTQAYSQVYMLAVVNGEGLEECENETELALVKIDPLGNETIICVCPFEEVGYGCLGMINQEINLIVNEGYKLMAINSPNGMIESESGSVGQHDVNFGTVFIFAAP